MWAEQAIFTSLPRRDRAGYHLVSRSRGLDAGAADALARSAPSHGALIVDAWNRSSVNFQPLPAGRFALSRTCAGAAEYSGRGGSQLYTHFLVVDDAALGAVDSQPFAIYRDAMAMGYLLFQHGPDETLEAVPLSPNHPRRDATYWETRAVQMGLAEPRRLRDRLEAGVALRFAFSGDRTALAECLVGMLSRDAVRRVSFSTSLVHSSTRPSILTLEGEGRGQAPRKTGRAPGP